MRLRGLWASGRGEEHLHRPPGCQWKPGHGSEAAKGVTGRANSVLRDRPMKWRRGRECLSGTLEEQLCPSISQRGAMGAAGRASLGLGVGGWARRAWLCWVSGCVWGTEPELGAEGKPLVKEGLAGCIQGPMGIS